MRLFQFELNDIKLVYLALVLTQTTSMHAKKELFKFNFFKPKQEQKLTVAAAVPSSGLEQEIGSVLETCLFDKNNTQPFSYFIDKLVGIATQKRQQLLLLLQAKNVATPESFISTFVSDLQSIRTSTSVMHVGKILSHYKFLLPPSLQTRGIFELANGLKFRLSQTASAASAQPEVQESAWQSVIAYLQQLFSTPSTSY